MSGGLLVWSVFAFSGTSAFAQKEWKGGGSNTNYTTGNNWIGGVAPASGSGSGGENALFGNAPTSGPQTVSFSGNVYVGQITINSSLSYTLTGGSLIAPTSASTWTVAGSGTQTIASSIRLRDALTLNNIGTGVLNISSNVSAWSGSGPFTLAGTGVTNFSGSINGGVDFAITGGINTITGSIGSSIINISGGTNLIGNSFSGGGKVLTITGGNNTITGGLGGGADITVNATGGNLVIEGDIGGGADIHVSEGGLTLNGNVASGAAVLVDSGGTLLLTDGVTFGGGSNVALNGGTLAATGNVSIPNVTLTGDSVIDLGNDPNAQLDIGSISGSGTINVINYVDTNQISFNPGGSPGFSPEQQVTFNGTPATTGPGGNTIVPVEVPVVPEPGAAIGLGLLGLLVCADYYRRRRRQAAA